MPKSKPEQCLTCGLFSGVKSYKIGYRGARNPNVLFIGEAPGRWEDIKGKPFVGDSGTLLKKLIKKSKLTEFGFTFGFTNAVRCRPKDNATPPKRIINLCKPFLLDDIDRLDPDILVPLGNVPLVALLGKQGITNMRGMVYNWEHPETGKVYPVFPTFHPAYLKRNPSMESFVSLDLQTIISLLSDESASKTHYSLITSEKSFQKLSKMVQTAKTIAFDIETSTLTFPSDQADILMASFSSKPKRSHVALLSDQYRKVKPSLREKAKDLIVNMITDKSKTIVGANIAFDIGYVYYKYGVLPKCKVADVQIYHYLAISEEGRATNLKKLALAYTDLGDYDKKLNNYFYKHELRSYGDIPLDILWPYCATDADATIRVYNMLKPKIDKEYRFIAEWLNRGVVALAKARVDGMKIDRQLYYQMRDNFDGYLSRLLDQILEREDVKKTEQILKNPKGQRFNPKSNKQMKVLVYQVQKFPVRIFTDKGNPSVNAKALELCLKTHQTKKSKYFHKTLELIQEYITHRTLRDMFINPMPNNVDKDFFIHPIFGLTFTVTGRLNCTNPNVQQIPAARGVDPDFYIKRLFVSRYKGGKIAVADYSQMELRILAMISKDPVLLDAFRTGKDIHKATSDEIFGPGDPDGSKRKAAKIVNFGVIYGEQAPSLAAQIGCSVRKAQRILDGYWNTYKKVKTLFFQNERFLLKHGYVTSLFGRKRRFGLNFKDKYYMARIKRQANNVIVQGPASDVNFFAFILLSEIIIKHGLKSIVCGLIHDSVVVDIPPDEEVVMAKLIPYVMEKLVVKEVLSKFEDKIELVPLKVDLSMGPNWAEQTKLEAVA